jgi:hypothetical protein
MLLMERNVMRTQPTTTRHSRFALLRPVYLGCFGIEDSSCAMEGMIR